MDGASPSPFALSLSKGRGVDQVGRAPLPHPTRLVQGLSGLRALMQGAVAESQARVDVPPSLQPSNAATAEATAQIAAAAPVALPPVPAFTPAPTPRPWPELDAVSEDMLVDRLVDRLQERWREHALRQFGFTGGLL
ncbi:hypothetical protein GCM10009107_23040 [Ideonella azotifigens]|uniref:Uncharacterized protein n=1 Tax=Ideonella azotifigens TaxID=513160 RepID=A0ABN1K0J7_9BURK